MWCGSHFHQAREVSPSWTSQLHSFLTWARQQLSNKSSNVLKHCNCPVVVGVSPDNWELNLHGDMPPNLERLSGPLWSNTAELDSLDSSIIPTNRAYINFRLERTCYWGMNSHWANQSNKSSRYATGTEMTQTHWAHFSSRLTGCWVNLTPHEHGRVERKIWHLHRKLNLWCLGVPCSQSERNPAVWSPAVSWIVNTSVLCCGLTDRQHRRANA